MEYSGWRRPIRQGGGWRKQTARSGGVFSLVSDEVVDAGTVAMVCYGFGFFFCAHAKLTLPDVNFPTSPPAITTSHSNRVGRGEEPWRC